MEADRANVAAAEQILVVLSDIEIGAGGPTDDFPQSRSIGDLLDHYNTGQRAGVAVHLVLNGDTFDFLKTSVDGHYPRHVTEAIAVQKLTRVHAAHGDFFDGLRRFLAGGGARRDISFIVGNHDPELLFPGVQRRVRDLLGDGARVHFPGFSLAIGDVWVEHGSQLDPLFSMDANALFRRHRGQRVLNLPWGSVAVIDVALPMHEQLYHLDRLKPREHLMAKLPEFRELIIGKYWRYWTRDFWKGFAGDPTRQISWTMVKEIAYRFVSEDADVRVVEAHRKQLTSDPRYAVRVVGHEHEPGWWSHGNQRLLRTGAFRNEFMMHDSDDALEQLRPVHAEVWLRNGRAVRSQLVENDCTAPPPGYVLSSLDDLLPTIRGLLASLEGRASIDAEQAAQTAKEVRQTR